MLVVGMATACAVRPPLARPPIAPVTTPRPVTATPTPMPVAAAPPPCAPPPAGALPARADMRPPLVRVLLQGRGQPVLPEPGRRYACVVGDAPAVVLRGPITATAVAGRATVQVGAVAPAAHAAGVEGRLGAPGLETTAADGGGAHRTVIAVAAPGEGVDDLARRLRGAGFADQKVGAPLGGEVLLTGEGGAALRGPRVLLVPFDADPVRVGDKTVRGEIVVRPGAADVAVINVLNLEAYLRGVVPAEMGPRTFPLIEALKAQAVAARTYAVAHIGDHADEGYDLCDSPACQAYEGAGAEQPLTDRAVQETAGEIITYQGRPIDAMYQSTCGGHTEDAGALFPNRAEPYLKGVPCRNERTLAAGAGRPGPWLGPVARLAAVGRALAAGLAMPAGARALASRLAGVEAGPGVAGIAHAFAVESTAATLNVPHRAAPEGAALELLRLFRLPLPPPGRADAAWEMALTVRLGQLSGAVRAEEGRLVPGPGGVIRLDNDGGGHEVGAASVLERRGERWRAGRLTFPAGSHGTLWCVGQACPVLEVEALEDADAGSAWSWWARDYSLPEIARRLGVADVRSIVVTRRGVSGRALSLTVSGTHGSREFAGIAFRRALDLPDTLFVVTPLRDPARPGLRFLGRGWGHGVGMCQNGAYGLAGGGADYVEILKTYYTGVEITRWGGESDGQREAATRRGP